jgi:hypothetical protein
VQNFEDAARSVEKWKSVANDGETGFYASLKPRVSVATPVPSPVSPHFTRLFAPHKSAPTRAARTINERPCKETMNAATMNDELKTKN